MDFKAINQLKIKEAFAGNQTFQRVVVDDDLLTELFECGNRGTLFVYDDLEVGHCVYVQDTMGLGRDRVFTISNSAHKDVFLWHIDGVLYKKNSKCDCAVLDERSFNLVEFKANAANESQKAIEENYQGASNQLLLTLKDITNRCNSVGIDIKDVVNVEAYAVFNRTIPRDDALRKRIAASFLFESKGVKLHFENSKKL